MGWSNWVVKGRVCDGGDQMLATFSGPIPQCGSMQIFTGEFVSEDLS